MRAWQKKNRKKVRAYNNQWRRLNPEKVKSQKQKSSERYKARRRKLYAERSPERIAADNAKAIAAYHRRYPNRSPEQKAKDKKNNQKKYQRQREELDRLRAQVEEGKIAAATLKKIEKGESAIPIGDGRMIVKKLGRMPDIKRAEMVCRLFDQGMKWASIKDQVEAKSGTYASIGALQELRRRHLARQKKPTN